MQPWKCSSAQGNSMGSLPDTSSNSKSPPKKATHLPKHPVPWMVFGGPVPRILFKLDNPLCKSCWIICIFPLYQVNLNLQLFIWASSLESTLTLLPCLAGKLWKTARVAEQFWCWSCICPLFQHVSASHTISESSRYDKCEDNHGKFPTCRGETSMAVHYDGQVWMLGSVHPVGPDQIGRSCFSQQLVAWWSPNFTFLGIMYSLMIL